MIGKLVDCNIGMNRKHRLTFEMEGDARVWYDQYHTEERLDIDIRPHKEKRSNNANAYFHVLVNKIARAIGQSDDEVKNQLIINYGPLLKDKNGINVGFKLPKSIDANILYPHVRCFDTRLEGNTMFCCYLAYKGTSMMNTAEMAQLIDGAITAAQELGLETDTPAHLSRYKES